MIKPREFNSPNVEKPLLHDHHSHPLLYAAFQSGIDLSEIQSFLNAADNISQLHQPGKLVVAHHWKTNQFAIDASNLDKLPPVAIFDNSLHGLKLNSAASEMLIMEFGDDVKKVSDQDWYERNFRLVLNWFAMLGGSPKALLQFYDHLETLGIRTAEELLLVDEMEIQWFEQAGLMDRTVFWASPDVLQQLSQQSKTLVHGTKLFTDGAFGSCTAAISIPYVGQTDNRGMLLYQDDQLRSTIEQCAKLKRAIAIHAIGDVAIEQTISALESLNAKEKFDTIRIEHAQLINTQQAIRAKDMGVTLSMQPNFNSDSAAYADRLPIQFLQSNNPFRMLIDEVGFEPGVDLIFGSDGMPHGIEHAWHEVNAPPFEVQQMKHQELINGYTLQS